MDLLESNDRSIKLFFGKLNCFEVFSCECICSKDLKYLYLEVIPEWWHIEGVPISTER
ncbi:hypothetical protein SCOR_29910 [Sulfidibacter corallicola]